MPLTELEFRECAAFLLPPVSLPQMKGGAAMEIISKCLSNAIMRAAEEHGYQIGTEGVFALYNIGSSGLTIAEVICAMYNHVTKGALKSAEDFTSELAKMQSACHQVPLLKDERGLLYNVSKIGDVIFDCDVYCHKINITKFEQRYGSMKEVITTLWERRVNGLAALEAQNTKWEVIGG